MEPGSDRRAATQRRVLYGLGGLVAVLAIVVGVLAVTDDDGTDEATAGSTTTAVPTTSSSTVAPTTTVPAADLDLAMFPDRLGARSFTEPREVAKAFAVEVLGFSDPIVGPFNAGDARSGEVAIRVSESGPPTIVLLRQLSDQHWYAIGSSAEPIVLTTPTAGSVLTAPQPLLGQAYAFEGTVNVALYVDGNDDPIAETVVTGRGDGVLGDFSGEIDFPPPAGASRGRLVLRSLGGEDGDATLAATAIRIRFR
jgi:hypothetical protein